MAAPDAPTIIRNRTTDDTTELPDEKILEFLEQYEQNIDLATAEALEFMARNIKYNSVTRGGLSYSGPTLLARAEIYRTRGNAEIADTTEQDQIRANTMTRSDLYPDASSPEFSGYTWPNSIFS